MSQFFTGVTPGSLPPAVPLSFVTDNNSPAVPVANSINVFGGTSSDNNTDGIQTDGGSGSATLAIQLTNRAVGNVQTVGLVSGDIITFTPPITAGTYRLIYQVAAYNSTDANSGAGYQIEGTVVSDGSGTFTTVGTPTRVMNGDTTVFDVTMIDVFIVGAGIVLRTEGITGKTVRWTGILNFVFGAA